MQLSKGIAKRILVVIICIYFIIAIVYASDKSATPATTNPASVPILINHSEISQFETPVPDITAWSTTKSSVFPVANNNQRLAPLNPDFIAYQKNIAENSDTVLRRSLHGFRKRAPWSRVYPSDNRPFLYQEDRMLHNISG